MEVLPVLSIKEEIIRLMGKRSGGNLFPPPEAMEIKCRLYLEVFLFLLLLPQTKWGPGNGLTRNESRQEIYRSIGGVTTFGIYVRKIIFSKNV